MIEIAFKAIVKSEIKIKNNKLQETLKKCRVTPESFQQRFLVVREEQVKEEVEKEKSSQMKEK